MNKDVKKYQCRQKWTHILVHEKNEDGTVVRKWENDEGEIVQEIQLNGTMSLAEMENDILSCFWLTGTGCLDMNDLEVFKIIHETKLPFIKEVRKYDWWIDGPSKPEEVIPKTYYELFSIIGIKPDEDIKVGEYTVYEYPKSNFSFKIKDDIIFYGHRELR